MSITLQRVLTCALVITFLASVGRAHAQSGAVAAPAVDGAGQTTAPPPPPPPTAAAAGTTAGRLGLGLDLTIVAYETTSRSFDSGGSVNLDTSMVGPGQAAGIGTAVSYGVSDDLLLTGRFALSRVAQDFGNGEISDVRFMVTPSLEVLLARGRAMRPFIGGLVGLMLLDANTSGASTTEFRGALGARAGVHAFIDPHVSVDPAVQLVLEAGLGGADTGVGSSESFTSFGGGVLLTVGLTYWK